MLLPLAIDCWADNMLMKYDPKTRTTRNNDGVEIRVPGFGNSTTVELIGNGTLAGSSNLYFHPIAEALVKLGYRRGVDMHGAPFDFRKAASKYHLVPGSGYYKGNDIGFLQG